MRHFVRLSINSNARLSSITTWGDWYTPMNEGRANPPVQPPPPPSPHIAHRNNIFSNNQYAMRDYGNTLALARQSFLTFVNYNFRARLEIREQRSSVVCSGGSVASFEYRCHEQSQCWLLVWSACSTTRTLGSLGKRAAFACRGHRREQRLLWDGGGSPHDGKIKQAGCSVIQIRRAP